MRLGGTTTTIAKLFSVENVMLMMTQLRRHGAKWMWQQRCVFSIVLDERRQWHNLCYASVVGVSFEKAHHHKWETIALLLCMTCSMLPCMQLGISHSLNYKSDRVHYHHYRYIQCLYCINTYRNVLQRRWWHFALMNSNRHLEETLNSARVELPHWNDS